MCDFVYKYNRIDHPKGSTCCNPHTVTGTSRCTIHQYGRSIVKISKSRTKENNNISSDNHSNDTILALKILEIKKLDLFKNINANIHDLLKKLIQHVKESATKNDLTNLTKLITIQEKLEILFDSAQIPR